MPGWNSITQLQNLEAAKQKTATASYCPENETEMVDWAAISGNPKKNQKDKDKPKQFTPHYSNNNKNLSPRYGLCRGFSQVLLVEPKESDAKKITNSVDSSSCSIV